MTDSGARRGAANLAPVLMIVSFAMMAGFLVWLGMTSEGTAVVAMNEDEGEDLDSLEVAALTVTGAELTEPDDYVGQLISVEGPVEPTQLGSQAFYLDLPQNPFVVKIGEELVAEGRTVPTGLVRVTGTVRAMSDSIAAAWVEAGGLNESHEMLVAFSTHFIDAERVRSLGPAPAGGAQPPGAAGQGGPPAGVRQMGDTAGSGGT